MRNLFMCFIAVLFINGCASTGQKYKALMYDIDYVVLREYEKALNGQPIAEDRKIDELTLVEKQNRMNSIRSIRYLMKQLEN